ncbi:TIGR02678 family protein [Actinacidiphila yanglinensis]|uniref:TIGR02678 family protein n=1 Tax=Actinacidiphila yanglinensis TaxID=310779 RepID=A0A1H6DJ34_9ACTN|nr:TIGR02678 family protein [Actinacidiphila yanglinensis]SEG85258.1 TIGR02678 family protein [Actinacidiphila yanglinensis]SEG91064.1 TIGR02678 family protein [Actinacidiphila yanglinensis]
MNAARLAAASAATAEQEASERRTAARTLLGHPLLTSRRHPEELALVRRHAMALKTTFSRVLGYHLIVESSFARLVKAPLSPDGPQRVARRGDGPAFTPQTYALFALACAALLAPGIGEFVLISSLVDQLRADAAAAEVTLQDSPAENRRLAHALGLLIEWGVLSETDGSVQAWAERKEEGVLAVHRSLLPHLLARPLRDAASLQALWAVPEEPAEPRRSLRRRLVENPLVRREDLSDGERDVLSRERSELTRLLDEHFGLTLEVRAEGVLAYDTDGALSDVEFPGPGTVRQAALLLCDALIDLGRPAAGVSAQLADGDTSGMLVAWSTVADEVTHLTERHHRAWSGALVADPGQLQAEVIALLESLSLARGTPEGLLVHAAVARYRPAPHTAEPSRATRRLHDLSAPAADAQTGLFDAGPAREVR